jgi:hypothetical protein
MGNLRVSAGRAPQSGKGLAISKRGILLCYWASTVQPIGVEIESYAPSLRMSLRTLQSRRDGIGHLMNYLHRQSR